MAIAMCSSSSYSPNLPSVSLSIVPAKSSLKSPHYLHLPASLSSTSPGLGLVSDNVLTGAAAAEAGALSSAAALAARDAAVAFEVGQTVDYRDTEDGLERGWNRRRRRRKRRKGLEYAETEVNSNGECEHVTFSRKFKSGYLTPKEEAEYSRCLKVLLYSGALASGKTNIGHSIEFCKSYLFFLINQLNPNSFLAIRQALELYESAI